MGLVDRLIRGAEYRAAGSGLANPAGWLLDAFGTSRTFSGQRVTVDKALGIAPVWSAVSLIAETVGDLPLKVFRELNDDERVEASEHRAYRMLHGAPNPVVPAHRFWSTATAHLLLWGNAFVEKLRGDSGLVEELWLHDPSVMTIEWNGATRTKRFVFDGTGGRQVWSDEGMLHITGLSLNGLVGESVISRCRQTLGTAIARDEFEGTFYGRGANVRGVIQHPSKIGHEAVQNLRESFNAIYGGSSGGHQSAVLEEGATFMPVTMPLSDLEFVASQQLTRTDVALMFKLPPAYLGGSTGDSLTYSTVESNQIQFAQNAITPWTSTIAKTLASDPGIFPYGAWYPEFVLEGLMRGDHQARAQFYATMFGLRDDEGKRALSVDEIRKRENLPPAETPPQVAPPVPPVNGNGSLTAEQVAALTS
jgi:HK97 family phage portal protein